MIRCVIFDLDGTLSDTAKATMPAICAAAAEFGLPAATEAAIKSAMGYASDAFYKILFPDAAPGLLAPFAERADQLESEMIRSLGGAVLFDGVKSALAELAAAGVAMHIASTGSEGHVGDVLSASGIRGYFAGVSCDEPEKAAMVGRIKRARADAAGRHLPDESFAMVGDKRIDADAARQNGILSVGAAYGYCGRPERELFDAIARHPSELRALLLRAA
ncbi:MAG: HAD family hydrolase [Clostridiales bacterium]|jgi:phosphoglycolate phosphatase|nr:HAD family hydrolase [Clostridiales bacterium]